MRCAIGRRVDIVVVLIDQHPAAVEHVVVAIDKLDELTGRGGGYKGVFGIGNGIDEQIEGGLRSIGALLIEQLAHFRDTAGVIPQPITGILRGVAGCIRGHCVQISVRAVQGP